MWAWARWTCCYVSRYSVNHLLCQVDVLLGNPGKARAKLGWNPTKTPFKQVKPTKTSQVPWKPLSSHVPGPGPGPVARDV
jgi:hypothetical protein